MKKCKHCSFQFTADTSDAYFCPQCGNPCLDNKAMQEATTANFDPLNPDFKPWRDIAKIPKRSYHSFNKKKNKDGDVIEPPKPPKTPWVPVGRQKKRTTKSSKVEYSLYSSSVVEEPCMTAASILPGDDSIFPEPEGGVDHVDKYRNSVGEETADAAAAEGEVRSVAL
jgi:hypothetical protein